MIQRIWLVSLLVFYTACGYKPSSTYSQKVLGDKIYVKVETSLHDPENTVLVRDALNEAVIYKLNAKIASKEQATATLYMRLASVSFQAIEYDNNGYVIAYKTNVTLATTYHDKYGKKKIIKSHGDFDFSIESNSVISDTKRFNAIKEASQKAIDAFISRMAALGVSK